MSGIPSNQNKNPDHANTPNQSGYAWIKRGVIKGSFFFAFTTLCRLTLDLGELSLRNILLSYLIWLIGGMGLEYYTAFKQGGKKKN